MSRDVKMSKEWGHGTISWTGTGSFLLLTFILFSPRARTHSGIEKEQELQKIFHLRNEDDWKSAWHLEKHVRCRDQLLTHMDWACKKDVYRLDKKPKAPPALEPFLLGRAVAKTVIKPWTGYIRRKRENKSITDECCSAAGCTWEEYAEYCPAHRRHRVTRGRNS